MSTRSLGAAALRAWREREGMTQFQAAGRIGIDFTYLTRIERGARKPGRVIAVKLEEVAGIPVADWDAPAKRGRKAA